MLTVTTESNYLAKVVKLGQPKKHPNADKLQIWDIDGYEVITDLTSKPGDIKIFFPVECQINDRIISKLNLYSDKTLNSDSTISGYIGKQRRVKAVKLRDVISEGMLLPADDILDLGAMWLNYIGTKFDTVSGTIICQKYVPEVKEVRSGGGLGKPKGSKVSDILVPGQFNFHYSTSKLQDNLWQFTNPNDVIVITDKWHGTSAVFANLLCYKKLSLWQKLGKFFGAKISTTEYRNMYASRSVLKHIEDVHQADNLGFYNVDLWGKVFKEIEHLLFPGITIYGEIVGYVGDTKMIQKGYDYGCKPGQHKFLVYRITHTYSDNHIEEYSWHEIQDFCKEHGLETVKELYYGTIENFLLENAGVDTGLLDTLKGKYLEQMCTYCKSKVPSEGICVRNESSNKLAYKLKSKMFLLKESQDLDTATEVID